MTCFVISRKYTRLADWIWRQRPRSLSWPAGWCFKSKEAWTSALWRFVDEIPSSFRDKTSELAIHNPHYRQQSRVRKGGTDITIDVCKLHVLLMECLLCRYIYIYKLAGRLMLAAKMSGPVRSEEEYTFHGGIPSIYSVQNYVDWRKDVSIVTVAGRLQKVHSNKRHG